MCSLNNKLNLRLFLLSVALIAYGNDACAFEPTPALIEMSVPGAARSTITGTNHSVTASPIEVIVNPFTIDEDGTKRLLPPSADIKVVPSRVMVPAGGTQTFRVQWNGGVLSVGKTYQLSFRQVPVQIETATSAINMVRSFYVLAIVSPDAGIATLSGGTAVIEITKDGARLPVVNFTNTGTRVALLSKSTLTLSDQTWSMRFSTAEMASTIGSGIILPGEKRRFTLQKTIPAFIKQISMRIELDGRVFSFNSPQTARTSAR